MGRAKFKMEFIENKKKRQSTYQQRKKCLFKKANELSMLCDVKAGIIIYGLDSNHQPEIWARDPDDIKELLNKYKNQESGKKIKRCKDLSVFFEDQMNKSKTVLSKLQKKNNEALYPTWNSLYDELSEEHLRKLAKDLDDKLEAAKARLDSLKGFANLQPLDQYQHAHDDVDCNIDSSSDFIDNQMMMEMLSYVSDCPQFGDASYFTVPPLNGGELFFDPTIGMAMNSAAPMMCYSGLTLPEQYTKIVGSSTHIGDFSYSNQTAAGPSTQMGDFCFSQTADGSTQMGDLCNYDQTHWFNY